MTDGYYNFRCVRPFCDESFTIRTCDLGVAMKAACLSGWCEVDSPKEACAMVCGKHGGEFASREEGGGDTH